MKGVDQGEQLSALSTGFSWETWHTVSAEIRSTRLTVEVTGDRLRDAVAEQTRTLPTAAVHAGAVGTAAKGAGAEADDVGATALHTPVTTRAPVARSGALLPAYSDEFDTTVLPGTTAGSAWSWVRGSAAGTTTVNGALSWPTSTTELYLGDSTAPVLLRPAPTGDYTVETRLHFAPTTNAQQAGLVLYENDDRFFKLTHSVLPLNNGAGAMLHVTQFGKARARDADAREAVARAVAQRGRGEAAVAGDAEGPVPPKNRRPGHGRGPVPPNGLGDTGPRPYTTSLDVSAPARRAVAARPPRRGAPDRSWS
ncbi:hypothetical protein ABZ401_16755 [Streptomyces sp. NPDC005892]|uniref:beta-xylosidase family glycoside hydrolase n=1 Tax=Streptomyces sp. NPDC005892 TaxID=3155593 RepID=UPI0033ECD5A2